MAKLGAGFAAAVQQASAGAQGELARMFDTAFAAMGEELYRKLRDDLIVEVRGEVQRVAGSQFAEKIAAAIEKIGTPIVHVAPAQVTVQAAKVEVLPADVTVNVPAPPPAQIVIERPKRQKIITDAEGHPTGIESVD